MKQSLLRKTQYTLMALALTVSLTSVGFADMPSYNGYQPNLPVNGTLISQGLPPLQGYVSTVPSGTVMSTVLQTPLSSEYARPGDRFTATLGASVVSGQGGVVLPAGSVLEGQIVSSTRSGRAGRNGTLDIRFVTARTPSGLQIPISARIQTQDGTGVLKGGTTKGRVGKTAGRAAVGAGLGAALGSAMGALSGGRVGRGSIFGTAIGGGMGAAYAGMKKGKPAILPAGQPVNVVLDAPISSTGGAAPAAYGQQQQQQYSQQPVYGQPPANPYNTNPYATPQPNPYAGSGTVNPNPYGTTAPAATNPYGTTAPQSTPYNPYAQ